MKVLIVEDALTSLSGHWFQYISDIVRDGAKAGYFIEVAVPKDASPEVMARLPSYPILSSSLSKRKGIQNSFLGSLWRIFSSNYSLFLDLKGFLKSDDSYDIIIVPSTRVDHLFAFYLLYLNSKKLNIRKIVLIFIDTVGIYSKDYSKVHFSKKSLIIKYGLKLTRLFSKTHKLNFAAESLGVARQFQLLSGVDFGVVPHVTVLPSLDGYRDKATTAAPISCSPLVLGTYGFTRYDKGLDILQDAIKLLPTELQNANLRFILQWTGDYELPDGKLICKDPFLEKLPIVTYIPAFDGSDQYYSWIAKTNIMVLPYRRDFYCDRLSRVAIDAAIAGIPIVYPRGTWLESFVRSYASGVPFDAEDPLSLAESIGIAITRFVELRDKASKNTAMVADVFSAKAFFESIIKL